MPYYAVCAAVVKASCKSDIAIPIWFRHSMTYAAVREMQKKLHVAGSLAEQAYARILDKILKGEYPLGAVLSRRKIGSEFGMSFLPISDALKRLEQEGLVESRPRVGTRVRIPSPQD